MPNKEPKFWGIPVYRVDPNVSYSSAEEKIDAGCRLCWANLFYTALAVIICYLPLEAYLLLKYGFQLESLHDSFFKLNQWIQSVLFLQILLHIIRAGVWHVIWDKDAGKGYC